MVKAEDHAEKLCRSAPPRVDGQDRQGASELQRHHHDGDLPLARDLGWPYCEKLSNRASCRSSQRPTRRRSSRWASGPCRPTATKTTCSRSRGRPTGQPLYAARARRWWLAQSRCSRRAESERRRLFQKFCSAQCQQLISESAGLRSRNPRCPSRSAGRKPFKDIKTTERRRRRRRNRRRHQSAYTKLFKV